MKKKFTVVSPENLAYETYEDAEVAAKQYTSKYDTPYAVMQAVAVTKVIVPDIEVTKL
jgi:hypothetical protein